MKIIKGNCNMNENLNEIYESLKELASLLEEKNKIESFAKMTKAQYLKKHIKIKEPKMKPIKKVVIPQEPSKPDINKPLVYTASAICGIASFVGGCALAIFGGATAFGVIGAIVGGTTCIVAPSSIIQKKETEYNEAYNNYKQKLVDVQKLTATNKKNEDYNKTYPELMQEYNDTVKKYELKYAEESASYKEKLDEINVKLEEYAELISPKYYQNIDEIITIIEDGRADSIKEALNIFVADSKQNELIKEQREANRIADKKREDARRHNLAMENEARRQSDFAARQVDAIKSKKKRSTKLLAM